MSGAQPRLGFIGLGLMGGPMTQRLLAAGYQMTVWNRTPAKLEPALALGAVEADSPAAVAAGSEFVLMCLTDAKAVAEVVFGDQGIASAAAAGNILIDFSSMRPDTTRELAGRLRTATGMGWIDAPVSGGVKGAEEGTLAILAGGAAADIDRARPLLAHLSQRVTHMGPSGAGQVTKLCNQIIVGVNLATIAEAVNLAAKAGIDAARLNEALRGGFGDSIPLQIFGPRFAARQTEPLLGHVFTMLKDLDTVRELGEDLMAPLPVAATVAEILRSLVQRGHAEHDIGTLMTAFDPPEVGDG